MLFPILESVLPQRVYAEFTACARQIFDGVDQGLIANATWTECKFVINRAFDKAWDLKLDRVRFEFDTDAARDLSYSIMSPQCHLVETYRKRIAKFVEKHGETDFTRAAAPLLDEIAPLARAVTELKNKTVKRQPKPVENRREKYDAPKIHGTALGAVKDVLVQVTDEAYDDLRSALVSSFIFSIDRYTALMKQIETLPRNHTRELALRETADLASNYPFIYQCVDRSGEKKPTWATIVEAEATKQADQTRDFFVYKNLDKVAAILDAKGDFEKIEIVDRAISLGGLEGTFRVSFKDGATFVMKNSVVYVVNSHGTRFNRFPLTFHNVVYADGTLMKQPSEKKMNEEFTQ